MSPRSGDPSRLFQVGLHLSGAPWNWDGQEFGGQQPKAFVLVSFLLM